MNIIQRLVFSRMLPKCNPLLLLENQVRTLYAPSALGIDAYQASRERIRNQFASGEDKFKSKMSEFCDENSKHMIFTEDLKSMVHLVEPTEDDLQIIHNMMKKFNRQNRELRFGSFIFGPVVMRMYYYLGKPKEALAVFQDETLAGMFEQLITYQILMDLLFTTEHYDEVVQVFQIIKDKQLQPNRYPKNVVVLFYAACYKLNTPEALKLASETWQELKTAGHNPMRRAVTFAAALALKQNAPHVALEILSTESKQNYITVRNLKAQALSELGRPDAVVPILRSVLSEENAMAGRKHTFTQDTMDKVRKAMERCSEQETVIEFKRIDKQLQTHGLIVAEPLDTFLLTEIAPKVVSNREGTSQRQQFLAGSYNRRGAQGSGGGSRYQQRPGLSDMV